MNDNLMRSTAIRRLFMNEILSYDEIQRRYDSEWVLIAYTEMDDNFEVVAGEVIAHSSIEQEIYKLLPLGRGRNVSIEYIGKVPADIAFSL
jgi:hypothetical protein